MPLATPIESTPEVKKPVKESKKKIPASPATPAATVIRKTDEVKYKEVTCVVASPETGGPITVEFAKEYLGWQVIPDEDKETEPLFTDLEGKRIFCANNTRNRIFTESWSMSLAQELLQLKWRLNGETIVVGKTGEIISGQHRLIGLVLAEQLRQQDLDHWKTNWPDEVTMNTILVFGIEESDDVVNTTDGVKPRSFSDVLYRSELFTKYKDANKKKAMARACDNAVKVIWDRAGIKDDAYAPIRTHQEGMDFLYRHPKLLDCVSYVVNEEHKGSISGSIPIGSAGALCYLMGVCKSNPETYVSARAEASLDTDMIGKAQEFWMDYASQSVTTLNALRESIKSLVNPTTGKDEGSFHEKTGLFIKAWNLYSAGKEVTKEAIKLKYVKNEETGTQVLDDHPLIGGIDIPPKKRTVKADPDVTVKEVADAAKKVKEDGLAKKKDQVNNPSPLFTHMSKIRTKYPDHVLFFEAGETYTLYGRDADHAISYLGQKAGKVVDGMKTVTFKKTQLKPAHEGLNEAGYSIATVEQGDDKGPKVTALKPIAKKKTAKPTKK